MFRMSAMSSGWTFETYSLQKKSYLTRQGRANLKIHSYDVLKVLRANCYHQDITNLIQVNDIVFGPLSNTKYKIKSNKGKWWCNLYKATRNEQFIIVKNTKENINKATQKDLEIYDFIWFRFKHGNGKLYFYSSILKNICQLSMYWTDEGEDYIVKRRKSYVSLVNNPQTFGSNEMKSYKQIPAHWI